MKLKYMNVEITYGNIIHDDGTVLKRTTTTYETMDEFREAWNNLTTGEGYIREANIKELSIEQREYVPLAEYLDVYDMSQEEEE